MNFLAVFIGGGLGSLARYGISQFFNTNIKLTLPLATLSSNFISCIIFGVTLIMLRNKTLIPETMVLFILTGFCGGFSTFSTFSFETVELVRSSNYLYASLNILFNLTLCLGIVYLLSK